MLRSLRVDPLPHFNFFWSIVTYFLTLHNIYKKAWLANYVNNQCGTNLGIDFVERLIIEQGNCYEKDNELISVIKYLKDKYDLVVLSNWFTETQKLRLNGVGILDYFTFVSGGDERILKPDTKAFDIALDGYSKEECLMVGDSLNHDIIPASKIGMPCIWISKEHTLEYETAKDVYQLKKIL